MNVLLHKTVTQIGWFNELQKKITIPPPAWNFFTRRSDLTPPDKKFLYSTTLTKKFGGTDLFFWTCTCMNLTQ